MSKKTKKEYPPTFPATVLKPVSNFLSSQLSNLEKRKKKISRDDPFRNTARVDDNAAADIEADEQFGHARVSAIKEQIDRRIIQTRKALTRIKIGKYGICENCGQMIDTDRLMVYPEATRCIKCERKK
ncbi:MAG: TraR/DksA C4-type zinc finger protein [Candidatus Woesebacteria bacterium]|nr:MAG: TraR/DksA C4-type zinc finger protein [Candidatus Woesebacteria bacterium]